MIKKSLCILSFTSLILADTTMCFKKDWLDPSTIESVTLDGGKCNGKLSLIDMKNNGYKIDTMKVQNSKEGLNYVYIFVKDDTKQSNSTNTIKQELVNIKKQEKQEKSKETIINDIKRGEEIYKKDCIKCHGQKAEISAYNTSRALNSLTIEQMENSLHAYSFSEKDNGFAILMKPYAEALNSKEVVQIFKYIETLK